MKFLGIDLDRLWWNIASGLMEIIDWLGNAFNFLVGSDMTSANKEGKPDDISNLFVTIFNGYDGTANMTKIYLMMMGGCIVFLGICVVIGVLKSQFTKAPTESLQNLGIKTLFSIIKMACIPIVFLMSLQTMVIKKDANFASFLL